MADYKYTPADFKSDQEVRWCPGCGDHAILNAVQRALPEIADQTDTPHNLFTFISGIGCSSRFIYYMKTFGFHSVHGRANAIATGVKSACSLCAARAVSVIIHWKRFVLMILIWH
jgi:2-oxoglutarate ferredoxin oxidoreductase subunit beta